MLFSLMKAELITILHPDDESGDKDLVLEHTGRVYPKEDALKISEELVPDWFRPAIYIVATDIKGNTIDGQVVNWDINVKKMRTDKRKIELGDTF